MTNQRYSKTTYMVLCGLFAAMTAICSLIIIPLGFTPIPLNLGTLAVFLTGGVLGKKYGTISMAVYVLLGAVGVPVFSGFRGGLGALAGPTGGYILGYVAAVFVIGLLTEKSDDGRRQAAANMPGGVKCGTFTRAGGTKRRTLRKTGLCICALISGLSVCYMLGTIWFMATTGTSLWASLTACVFPFLPGDAVKIVLATMLIGRLRPHII